MFMQDIERLFTEKVSEYLRAGYIFSTETMRDSQGEHCKVDLKKENHFIRVRLWNFSEMNGNGISLEVLSSEGEGIVKHGIVWNSDLEEVEIQKFYRVSRWKEFFACESDYAKAQVGEKRYARYKARAEHPKQLPEKAKAIILPYVRRMKGFKSAKLADVDVVLKVDGHYEASVRGRRVVLFQKEV